MVFHLTEYYTLMGGILLCALLFGDVINFRYFNAILHAPEGTIRRTLVTSDIFNVFHRIEYYSRLYTFPPGSFDNTKLSFSW